MAKSREVTCEVVAQTMLTDASQIKENEPRCSNAVKTRQWVLQRARPKPLKDPKDYHRKQTSYVEANVMPISTNVSKSGTTSRINFHIPSTHQRETNQRLVPHITAHCIPGIGMLFIPGTCSLSTIRAALLLKILVGPAGESLVSTTTGSFLGLLFSASWSMAAS